MVAEYIFYSSLTLSGMGCLALILSLIFRLKSHKINSLSRNVNANDFSRTFNVLDPYGEKIKIIHKLLSLLPLLLAIIFCFSFIVLLEIIEYGLLLSFLIAIVGLNLMLMDVFSDVYQNANIFIKAVNAKADLGVGDVKVFQILKNAIPKLSNYHLILSIFFFTFAFTISYIWSSIQGLFSYLFGLMFQISTPTGFAAIAVILIIFVSIVVVIQVLVGRMKNRFLMSITETPGFKD